MLFMAGTTMMSNVYVRLRFGKVPVGAELEALRVSDPLRFEKLSRTLKQGQMIGEVIDAADGLSDMSGAFALVDDIDYNNPEHLAALAARFGMSLWDTVDWKSSNAGNVTGPTDSAPQVIENFNLNDVVGDVRFSGNGQALFVSNQDLVAELYVQSRVKDLETSSDHQGMTQEQLVEIARTESQGVVAFAERNTGRMVVPETRGADRQQRIIAASFMAHENAHLEGKPEFDAWRAQADYLERNGLQLEFSNGQPIIRAASGDVVVHTPDSHIEEYLAANYSARDRGEQGTLPQVMAARNTSTSGELSTVTSQEAADLLEFWDEDQAALNPDERSDLYWALRGQEMLGLAENVELLETAARERLVAELGLTDAMSIEERDLTARRAEAMGLLETAPEAVQQQLVDAVSIVSLAESYNADPSSLTASDATELFFAARRQNETARIDDLAALESTVRAHLQSEADQLRVNTRSLSIREQAVLQQQLTDLDMLEMQDGGVKQTLARAVEIDALRREYRADPASMTRERRGELYWALHERGEIAGDPAADALKQSAQEIAQDTAYQIEADLSAASHRQLLELEHQLSVLGMLGQQSAELRGQLDSAVDFELQLTTVAEGDIVGESEFVDFAASLRALMRQEQRPLEAYLPSTHPQYHRLAENLSRIDGQDLGELVERVAAQTGESVETVEQVLHDMSLYAGQHGSITREGVEHIRAQLRERGMLKRGAEDTNAVIFIPGGDTVADQLAAMPLGRNHARLNTTSDITEADVLIVDQAILHRLENDADFARAVVENDVQLMVVGGYAGTLNLDGTRGRDALGQIEQQLTASVEQFRASRARATTVPQLTTDELSTQLEGVFDALEKENYYLGDSLGGFSDDTLGRRLLLSGLNNNGLLIQAEKLVENGDADNLVTALEQVTQSELDTLLDLAREARAEGKEIDPQVYSELRHYTEIMAGIQRYRENLTSRLGYSGSGLQVPGTDTAELVRRAIRSHDLGIPHRRVDVMSPAVPESGNVREAIVDQLGQPPVRFETHSELEQDGLYLSDRYGWIQVVGRTADGALEVIRFEKKPRTPLTADQIAGRNPVDGSQRRPPRRIITIQPDSNLRFADWRNDVALSNQALVDRGITVENAALWFSMGDLHQQFANRPREGVAARRYERLNSILQEVAPGQNLDTFLQQMEQSLVGGELSAENAATAQQFLIEVYRQTGVDLVQIGTARQAAQNAAYSWRSFPEIVAEPTVFNGQTDVARVDIFVDSFVRDQLWENGVSVFDPNLREGSTQGQEHPRRAFFNDFYPKGREGENRPVNEFSRRMWELKKDAEEGRMDDLATHATEMVQENREALNAFLAEHAELLDGRPVVVVSMPGSSGAQSASAALAEAVAEELGYDHQQLLDRRSERHTRGRNSDRQSRVETKPQKTQKTRTRRMRNSGNTYALNADGESLAENTVVILIDDNSTYDVTLNVGRERLLPNDVLAISFGRTVRSQSNVSN